MKNILLPTDFSKNSWTAVNYALKLYKNEVCVFYLLNASELKLTSTLSMSKKLVQTIHKKDKDQLQEFKEKIKASLNTTKHQVKTILSSESLFSAIELAVQANTIDLIVMGTKGATGIKELVLGSNAVKIINTINTCPVLVIPENCTYKSIKSIAFPTDYSRTYTSKELKPIVKIANLFGAKIQVLYVAENSKLSQKQKDNKALLKQHLQTSKSSFHWALSYVKVALEISSFVEDYEIDMLTMVKYKHSYFEKILREPIIKKIGFHIKIPFLVIPQ